VRQVATVVRDISSASGEQQQGIEQIGEAINHIDSVTQQNAALVEEAAAAAESLRDQARRLDDSVALFKLRAAWMRLEARDPAQAIVVLVGAMTATWQDMPLANEPYRKTELAFGADGCNDAPVSSDLHKIGLRRPRAGIFLSCPEVGGKPATRASRVCPGDRDRACRLLRIGHAMAGPSHARTAMANQTPHHGSDSLDEAGPVGLMEPGWPRQRGPGLMPAVRGQYAPGCGPLPCRPVRRPGMQAYRVH
jgi:hypothetical protein